MHPFSMAQHIYRFIPFEISFYRLNKALSYNRFQNRPKQHVNKLPQRSFIRNIIMALFACAEFNVWKNMHISRLSNYNTTRQNHRNVRRSCTLLINIPTTSRV